jgi:hypothetical protein
MIPNPDDMLLHKPHDIPILGDCTRKNMGQNAPGSPNATPSMVMYRQETPINIDYNENKKNIKIV